MEFGNIHKIALLGFLGAMLFGAMANKTQFCTMGAISDWIHMGSKTRFRTWVLAIAIALLGSQLLQAMGLVDLNQTFYLSTNFTWFGYIFGGFLFGIGMTLGAGCGQRTLVRVGGGNLKSLLVLLVLGLTAYATLRGLLAYVRIDVVHAVGIDLAQHELQNQSIPSVISYFTGVSQSVTLAVCAVLIGAMLLMYVFKDSEFRQSRDNIIMGFLIGLLVTGAWYVTGVVGFDDFDPVPLEALTFIAPAGNMLNYLMTWTGSVINFGIAIVFGMLLGSFIYALLSRTFRIETFTDRGDMLNHLAAGVLMGFGGVLSFGCTIGQGVSGMSTLALGSLLALISIIAGSAFTLKFQYHLLDDEGWGSALRNTLAELHLLPGRGPDS